MNCDQICYQICSATTGLAMAAAPKSSKGREGKVRRRPHCRAVWLQLLGQERFYSHTLSFIPAKADVPSLTQLLLRLEAEQMQDLGPSAFLSVYEAVKRYLSHFQSSSHPCANLEFPAWQCAGSWQRLQTKPKLWELV